MFHGALQGAGGDEKADFRKAAEAGGFTGNIIVGTDLAGLRIQRSEVDQLRQALP